MPLRLRPAALALGATLIAAGLLAPAAADASQKRGLQRNYAGVSWHGIPSPSAGFQACLRFDAGKVRDGGYIAQTLWVATNPATTQYGKNKRTPYVQVALTKGIGGTKRRAVVASQLDAKGGFHQTHSFSPARYPDAGKCQVFSIITDMTLDKWLVTEGGGGFTRALEPTGGSGKSHSAYAGLESTSGRNSGRGSVSNLLWVPNAPLAPGTVALRYWAFGGPNSKSKGPNVKSKLTRRGPGRVRWTDYTRSFSNSFGR